MSAMMDHPKFWEYFGYAVDAGASSEEAVAAVEMALGSGAALAVADDKGGRWITIGGQVGQDGKRHGGSPVYVQNGRITRGAPSLAGRRIDALKEEGDPGTHRQQLHREKEYSRARAAKEAKAEGIDPADLHGLAAEILAHDREHSGEREEVLRRARDLFRHYGYGAESLTTNLRSGRVEDNPHALDLVADSLARSYPHQFAGHDDYGERLLDLFREGKPRRMTEHEAYEAAREQLREQRRAFEAEDVPFSVGLATSPVLTKLPADIHRENQAVAAEERQERDWLLGPGPENPGYEKRQAARRRYSIAEGRRLVEELRQRGMRPVQLPGGTTVEVPLKAPPPVQPPSPHEPVVSPKLLQTQQGVQPMADVDEIPEGADDLAGDLRELLAEPEAPNTDEGLVSELRRLGHFEGVSHRDALKQVRDLGERLGLLTATGWETPSSGGGQGNRRERGSNPNAAELREEWAVGFSVGGDGQVKAVPVTTDTYANQVVREQETAVQTGRVPRGRDAAALSCHATVHGISDERAERTVKELEKNCQRGRW